MSIIAEAQNAGLWCRCWKMLSCEANDDEISMKLLLILNKIRKNCWVLRFLPQILFFNFKMLPFQQALKLPIWLYKPKFGKLTGKVIFDMPESDIKMGLIRIGTFEVNIFPNSGCMIDNRGLIKFKGRCSIGNNSFLSVGETGHLAFGDCFCCTSSMKLVCYHSITFGNRVLVGWDCLFMDTDFHVLTRSDGSQTKGYAPIYIGDDVWFGFGCKVFKRAVVPSQCVVSAQTILSETIDAPERSVLGNDNKIIVKARGVYHKYADDKIIFCS